MMLQITITYLKGSCMFMKQSILAATRNLQSLPEYYFFNQVQSLA